MNKIIHFFVAGGPFMIPLAVCSVVGLAIIIERTLALRRKRVVSDALVAAMQHFQPGGDIHHLHGQAMGDGSSLSKLVLTALAHLDSPKSDTIDALQVCGRGEAVCLERGLVTLEIIVGIAPLLGLLGTVSGLITVFAAFGTGSDKESISEAMHIAAGISEALNMTVAGLVVAIPALVVHGYYTRRVEHYMSEMEGLCLDLLAKLYRAPLAAPHPDVQQ